MLNHLKIDELNISFIPQYMYWGIGGLGDWGIGGLGDWGIGGLGDWGIGGLWDWGIYPTTAKWRSSH